MQPAVLVLARAEREISFRQATGLSLFWIVLALLFGVVMFALAGPDRGGEYLAGYVIEKSLSVDNVFVFALIFSYFAVPARYPSPPTSFAPGWRRAFVSSS